MTTESGLSSARTMLIAAMATFGVVAWWATRGAPSGAEGAKDGIGRAQGDLAPAPAATAAATPHVAADARSSDADVARDATREAPPADDPPFATYVDRKYRYLARSPGLTAALLEREHIAVAINTVKQSADEDEKKKMPQLQAQLAEADRKVGGLLAPGDVAGYEVLRNSDMDQFQFEDYVGGVSHVAPLAEEKKQAILYARLSNRHRFNQVLENSGLMRGDLTPAQRRSAFDAVARALRESTDGFLQEARQHLHDEEQYTLLSHYENTEYSGELDKLRRIATGGTEGG